jgi:uncharacterized protein (DUF488 family)
VATVWTIGYEKLLPLELANELQHAGVQRVIDVRFRPQSRRPGMSKTRLSELLRDHGITYEHRKELGTPQHIRPLFHQGKLQEAGAAYTAHVQANAPEAIQELANELANPNAPNTALLCLEADPTGCHRRIITDELQTRDSSLSVVDL